MAFLTLSQHPEPRLDEVLSPGCLGTQYLLPPAPLIHCIKNVRLCLPFRHLQNSNAFCLLTKERSDFQDPLCFPVVICNWWRNTYSSPEGIEAWKSGYLVDGPQEGLFKCHFCASTHRLLLSFLLAASPQRENSLLYSKHLVSKECRMDW
jgi:hypothetical protein